MSKKIEKELTNGFLEQFSKNQKQQLAQKATVNNGINNAIKNRNIVAKDNFVFSTEIATGSVADQQQSGRCWMFAALNTFRHKILHNFNLKEFELSQNYTYFWDKYEKSNWFYEQIIATGQNSLDSRKVAFLLATPQQDGGQWDMIVNIFQKYGVVPKSAMPESANSKNSKELNLYLNRILRRDAIKLRKLIADNASAAELNSEREKMLGNVYNYLSISLGTPPEKFDFEYIDEKNDYHFDGDLTPQSFYNRYVGINLDDYVSIINAPTSDKPYHQCYTVKMLGNVVGGRDVKYLNLPMEQFKALAVEQLTHGESVWFGCDVGKSIDRISGVLDLDLYDLNNLFDQDFTMTKEERLDYGESMMTHAMVLTGVDLVNNQPTKWKIENSWGDKRGDRGFYVATDAWMDQYTYQIVIHRRWLSDDLKAIVDSGEMTPLAPWDPMGALA